MVGPENVLKKACVFAPYVRAYCEAILYPFELIFCVILKDQFANVFQKITLNGFDLRFIQSLKVHGLTTVGQPTFTSWAPSFFSVIAF